MSEITKENFTNYLIEQTAKVDKAWQKRNFAECLDYCQILERDVLQFISKFIYGKDEQNKIDGDTDNFLMQIREYLLGFSMVATDCKILMIDPKNQSKAAQYH